MFGSEKNHNHYLSVAIIVLIIINIVVNVISMQTVENLEIMKVGGKENYKKLQTIMESDTYKDQYAKNLELMLQQMQEENNKTVSSDEQQVMQEPIMSGQNTEQNTTTTGMINTNEAQG